MDSASLSLLFVNPFSGSMAASKAKQIASFDSEIPSMVPTLPEKSQSLPGLSTLIETSALRP